MPDSIPVPNALQSMIGQRVAGRYRVQRCVGLGAASAVFEAVHESLNRVVAIKVLRPSAQDRGQAVARFDREARIASALEHPNCIQVFDCGVSTDGVRFMVMPLLVGTELSRTLTTPLIPSQAVSVGLQIVAGLEYAHRCGIVHRDVKPENVYVVRDHRSREILKLVDFGIAKYIDPGREPSGTVTKAGLIVGTPTHMSPEQVMGLDVDVRSDLYSFGVTLFEMLSGKLPFDAETNNAVFKLQVKADPPPLPISVPMELRSLVNDLLAKKPSGRPPDAVAVIDALKQIRTLLSRDPTPWRPLLSRATPPVRGASEPPIGTSTAPASSPRAPDPHFRPPSERSGVQAVSEAKKRKSGPVPRSRKHVSSDALEAILEVEDTRPAAPFPKGPTKSGAEDSSPYTSLVPDFGDGGEGS